MITLSRRDLLAAVSRRRTDRGLAQRLRAPTGRRRDGVPTAHKRDAAASLRAEFVQRDFSTATSQPGPDRAGPDHPLVGVLCTPADGMRDWLSACKALDAMLLRATVVGANSSYLNQPVEEIAFRAELREQLQLNGVAQFILRVGVGGTVAATPRRHLDDLIYGP